MENEGKDNPNPSRYNLRDRKPQDSSEESQFQDSLFPLRRDLRLDFLQESDEGSPVEDSKKKNKDLAQNRDPDQSWSFGSFWGQFKFIVTGIAYDIASKIYSTIHYYFGQLFRGI